MAVKKGNKKSNNNNKNRGKNAKQNQRNNRSRNTSTSDVKEKTSKPSVVTNGGHKGSTTGAVNGGHNQKSGSQTAGVKQQPPAIVVDVFGNTDRRVDVKNVEKSTAEDASPKSNACVATTGTGYSPKGLSNLGNTCYLNSVLQVLSETHLLYDVLNERSNDGYLYRAKSLANPCDWTADRPYDDSTDITLGQCLPLTQSVIGFMRDMRSQHTRTVSPGKLLTQIRKEWSQFDGWAQQDSHELLRCLLDSLKCKEVKRQRTAVCHEFRYNHNNREDNNLDDDTKARIKSLATYTQLTPIDTVFGGQLLSSVRCDACHHTNLIFEPFFDLSLPLTHLAVNCDNNGGKADAVIVASDGKTYGKHKDSTAGSGGAATNGTSGDDSLADADAKKLTPKERKQLRCQKKAAKREAKQAKKIETNFTIADTRDESDDKPSIVGEIAAKPEIITVVDDSNDDEECTEAVDNTGSESAAAALKSEEMDKTVVKKEESTTGEVTAAAVAAPTNRLPDIEVWLTLLDDSGCEEDVLNRCRDVLLRYNDGNTTDEERDFVTSMLAERGVVTAPAVVAEGTESATKIEPSVEVAMGDPFGTEWPAVEDWSVPAIGVEDNQLSDKYLEDVVHEFLHKLDNSCATDRDADVIQRVLSSANAHDVALIQRLIAERLERAIVYDTDGNVVDKEALDSAQDMDDGGDQDRMSDKCDDSDDDMAIGNLFDEDMHNDSWDATAGDSWLASSLDPGWNPDGDTTDDYNEEGYIFTYDGQRVKPLPFFGPELPPESTSPPLITVDTDGQTGGATAYDEEQADENKAQDQEFNTKDAALDQLEADLFTLCISDRQKMDLKQSSADGHQQSSATELDTNSATYKKIIATSLETIGDNSAESLPNFDLIRLLTAFTGVERLSGHNKYLCEMCTKSQPTGQKVFTTAAKRALVALPPPVLTLHLKRFEAEGYRRVSFKKINTFVSFPATFDLAPFVSRMYNYMQPITGQSAAAQHLLYGLYGVVQHLGGLKSGHYTAYVKHRPAQRNQAKKFAIMEPYVPRMENVLKMIETKYFSGDTEDGNGSTTEDNCPLVNGHHTNGLDAQTNGSAPNGESSNDRNHTSDSEDKESEASAAAVGPDGGCKWYHISDSSVTSSSLSSVLRSQAYILFYERIV